MRLDRTNHNVLPGEGVRSIAHDAVLHLLTPLFRIVSSRPQAALRV